MQPLACQTTDKTPAELLFGRKMKTKLPEVTPTVYDPDLRNKDSNAKEKMKSYADNRSNAKPNRFQIGDDVLVRQRKRNKFSSYHNPQPYRIVAMKGSMITAENAKHRITRNSSHFKKIHQTPSNEVSADDYNDDDYRDMPNNVRQPVVNE